VKYLAASANTLTSASNQKRLGDGMTTKPELTKLTIARDAFVCCPAVAKFVNFRRSCCGCPKLREMTGDHVLCAEKTKSSQSR
jgi:hypothetical protein